MSSLLISLLVGCAGRQQTLAYWDAVTHAEPDVALAHAPDDHTRRYAQVLHTLMSGPASEARPDLEELMEVGRPRVARASTRLLVHLMRLESDWTGIAEMLGRSPEATFAAAMSEAPPEVLHQPEHAVTLPAPSNDFGVPTVTVVVNDEQRQFWIDTGAASSVVASDVAVAAGVSPLEASMDVGTATNIEVGVSAAVIDDLRVGPLKVQHHPVFIVDAAALTFDYEDKVVKIDGILGWPLIQQLHLELDYAAETLTMHPPGDHSDGRQSLYWLGFPVLPGATGDAQNLRFFLDTGAATSSLMPGYLDRAPTVSGRRVTFGIGGAGGWETVTGTQIDDVSVEVGGATVHFDTMEAYPQDFNYVLDADGVLGSDVGRGKRMRLDYPCRTFALEESDG